LPKRTKFHFKRIHMKIYGTTLKISAFEADFFNWLDPDPHSEAGSESKDRIECGPGRLTLRPRRMMCVGTCIRKQQGFPKRN
jgi:hypothetical protein